MQKKDMFLSISVTITATFLALIAYLHDAHFTQLIFMTSLSISCYQAGL